MKTLANLLALHVIELTIGGHTAYLAEKPEWDGAWFTRDIGKAKTYKLARNAQKRIEEHGSVWNDLAPHVTTVGS